MSPLCSSQNNLLSRVEWLPNCARFTCSYRYVMYANMSDLARCYCPPRGSSQSQKKKRRRQRDRDPKTSSENLTALNCNYELIIYIFKNGKNVRKSFKTQFYLKLKKLCFLSSKARSIQATPWVATDYGWLLKYLQTIAYFEQGYKKKLQVNAVNNSSLVWLVDVTSQKCVPNQFGAKK